MEYLPLAKALAIRHPYALCTIFLASLYQAMGKYVTKVSYYRVGGVIWLVHIWIFANFPELLGVDSFPSMPLDLSPAKSIRTISINSIFFLFS